MNGKELTVKENWDNNLVVAKDLLASKFLPSHITTIQQAAMIMEMGKELGIPPVIALNKIYVIGQKPALEAQLMLQLIYASDKAEYIKVEPGNNLYTVTMKRNKPAIEHTEVFGIKEATALFLMGKDNYKKQPMTMFKWRAISACARVVFPDIIGGMYTVEELEDTAKIDAIEAKVEKSEGLLTDTEEYDNFIEEKFGLIRDALAVATEPEQVSNLKKGFASDLNQMLAADKLVIETEIDNKYNELITGNAPKSKLEQYKELISQCPDKDAAKAWFKGINKELVKNLSGEEYKDFVEHCKNLFPEPAAPTEDELCISDKEIQVLEVCVAPIKDAFYRYLFMTYGIKDLKKIQGAWYANILSWAKDIQK